MAKCRLNLGKITKDASFEKIIICKKIHTITINGVDFFKSDNGDSKKIQNFYRFILKNAKSITYVKFDETSELFLKNNLLNNYVGPAHILDSLEFFFIEGEALVKEEWLVDPRRIKYMREYKLKRILMSYD